MMAGRNHRRFVPHTLMADIVAFVLAVTAGWHLFELSFDGRPARWLNIPDSWHGWFNWHSVYEEHGLGLAAGFLVVLLIVYWVRDLYAGRRLLQSRHVFEHIITSNLYALLVFWLLVAVVSTRFLPPGLSLLVVLLNTGFCLACRSVLAWCLPLCKKRVSLFKCPAIIVGQGVDAEIIHEWLNHDRPKGVFAISRVPASADSDIDAVIERIAAELAVTGAGMVISAERNFSIHQLMRLLSASESWGVPVKVLSDEMNVIFHNARLVVDMVRSVPLLHFAAFPVSPNYLRIKSFYSRVAAGVGVLVLSPLLVGIAVLVKFTSRGPVFFKQERIGANGQAFMMFKFRTMVVDADKRQAELESRNEAGAGLFKIKDDPRITPVGRLLRRFSLDELPQLINIVRGDMALVGPRPLPRRDLEHYYEDWHYTRHAGSSGLTGLWQVSGRSDIDFHNMCILDLYYLRNQSLHLDFQILLRTAAAVVASRGAY